MASTMTSANPELEESVLATLRRLQQQDGFVSNQDVARAATALQCSTRRIRRMLERGYVRAPRSSWCPDADMTTNLMRSKGSIAQTHAALCKKGQNPGVSVRTMQRYFANQYDQRLLAGARGGYHAMIAAAPTLERHIDARNAEWAIDHTLLKVSVTLVDGSIVQPWMTTVIDAATRMVMAFTIAPFAPTTEESVETIATAIEGFTVEDDDAGAVFVGGQPQTLHSDRGGDLVTRALTLGLIEQGTSRSFTEAYTPQQNGRIERWHRTIKSEVLPLLPGYDRTDFFATDPRREAQPVDPAGLLPIEGLQAKMVEALREYNFDRPHRSLGGRTPFAAWAADETEIQRADPQAIRASMTWEETRTVERSRVRLRGRLYQLPGSRSTTVDRTTGEIFDGMPWRSLLEGKKVRLRFLRTRVEYVEIYTDSGDYVGRARWTRLLDDAEAGAAIQDRRQMIATWNTALESLAQADAAAVAALTRSQTPMGGEPSADDQDFGARPSTATRKRTESAATTRRKVAVRERTREDVTALQTVIGRRTSTDDLDF